MHYELTFHLSHLCCRVRTDQLPFECDVRRSSRSTSTDANQAAQMALVMVIDSLIGGELGRASSAASNSGQAVGGSTIRHVGQGGVACRWAAFGRRRHCAPGRNDGMQLLVVPMHAANAASVPAMSRCPYRRSMCAIVGCWVHGRARALVVWQLSLGDAAAMVRAVSLCALPVGGALD